MNSLKELSKDVSAIAVRGAKKAGNSDWHKTATGYSVTLKYDGRKMTVDFWQGSALKIPPTSYDVLYCLLSDAQAADMTFEDFCSEFGYQQYGTAQQKTYAENTYRACKKIDVDLRKLLGDNFQDFMDSEKE